MTADIQWIVHDGGPNPVREGETLTHVRFLSGFEYGTGHEEHWVWQHGDGIAPNNRITHYAVTPPRREPAAEPVTDPIFAAIRAEIAKLDARRAMLVKMLEVGE